MYLYISCTTDRSTPKYWHAWVTCMKTPQQQEFSPKVRAPLVLYTVYTCTGENKRPLPYLGLLRPAKQHGQKSVIVFIVVTDSHRRWYLFKLLSFLSCLGEKNSWLRYSSGLMLLPAAILFPGILISTVEKLTLASPSSRNIISPNYPGKIIRGVSWSESCCYDHIFIIKQQYVTSGRVLGSFPVTNRLMMLFY